MKVNKNILIAVGVIIVLILAANPFFVVSQTQQAIVLEFGRPVSFNDGGERVSFIRKPGLKLKIPFIQEVVYFDNRILNFSATDKEILDFEKKTLTVNAFAKYKIVDPLRFYETVGDIRGINMRLDNIFEASLRDSIGEVTLREMLTEKRRDVMNRLQDDISEKSRPFGIEVFDVRIVRADLPSENSNAIFKRMFADRNKEAREYRAEGHEQAKIIISTANKEASIIKANAEKQSQIMRGEGDGEAIKIFSGAFNRDVEFYNFYRSMEAYRSSINKADSRIILSPQNDFMKYFWSLDGNPAR